MISALEHGDRYYVVNVKPALAVPQTIHARTQRNYTADPLHYPLELIVTAHISYREKSEYTGKERRVEI